MQNNKDIQKKYLELEIIIQQVNQIHNQIVALQTQILELENLKQNINNLNFLEKNTNSYVPLGLNIFAKAELKDTQEFLVGVGSNIFLKKNSQETIENIDSYINDIGLVLGDFQNQLNNLEEKGQSMQEELQQVIGKQ